MARKALWASLLGITLLIAPGARGMQGIVLRDMEGRPVRVDSLLAEGPVVLNFWATWCHPCKAEMPKLEDIMEELGERQVHFAAVSLDTRRNKNKVEEYIEEHDLMLPVYRDPEGSLARRFKVTAIPTTILLDQDSEVAYRTRGYRPGDEVLLEKEILALIEDRDGGKEEEEASQ